MAYNNSTNYFEGVVLLNNSFNEGDTIPLLATATDFFGNTGTTTRKVIYDNPPLITLKSPLPYSVLTASRTSLPVKLICKDIDSCSVSIFFGGSLLNESTYYRGRLIFSGKVKDSLLFTFDFSSFPDTLRSDFYVEVRDKKNQAAYTSSKIYIFRSPAVSEVYQANQEIADFKYNKILTYSDSSFIGYIYKTNLNIVDALSNTQIQIPISGFVKPTNPNPVLTPYGASFAAFTADSIYQTTSNSTYDWNNGTLDSLRTFDFNTFSPSRNYACFVAQGDCNLTLRNLATRVDTVLSLNTSVGYFVADVADNGTIVSTVNCNNNIGVPKNNIIIYKNGIITPLTNNNGIDTINFLPVTDGNYSVYIKAVFSNNVWTSYVYMSDGVTETQLSNLGTSTNYPSAYITILNYSIKNKFITYLKLGASGQMQVWLRDTLGVSKQISFFNSSSSIVALNEKGDVIYNNSQSYYLARLNATPILAPSFSYNSYTYQDSTWYFSLGRSLFRFAPTAPLPVKISTFSVTQNDNANVLKWSTATELGFAYFEIEKSKDGKDYVGIGKVSSNNIANGSNYTYTDMNVEAVVNYYRLRIVDKDGKFEYSTVLKVDGTKSVFKMAVYPNPVADYLNIHVSSDKIMNNAVFEILSVEGKAVKVVGASIPVGTYLKTINIANLSKGIYFIRCRSNDISTVSKFFKQ
ncbi:T9SS type A sorting domain-containing protein [Parasediminibacterium sp. JCM 36343]|uniref:T9SS type A sorting domain-containing protein n=1 Tax=Parasediminibacterium sp. JCM 36343 TaxID=3374279 RepID=UPI0039796B29